jgi:toxin FitB
MTVVLDTNVISELVRLRPEPRVAAFLDLFLQGVKAMYEGRIVNVDAALAEQAGRLRAQASRSGWVLSQFDSVIAATAIARGAQLATRNVVDFERLGVPLINPWDF